MATIGKIIVSIGLFIGGLFGYHPLGSFTTLNSTDTQVNFPTTYNANLNKTIEVGTTSVASITTLPNLASVGTITSGTWNGGIIPVAYGGTASATISTANKVVLANGASGFTSVGGFGSSGQFLTSAGSGAAPSWTTGVVDQTQNYTWTGTQDFTSANMIYSPTDASYRFPLTAGGTMSTGTPVFLATTTITATPIDVYNATDNTLQICTGASDKAYMQTFTIGAGMRIDQLSIRAKGATTNFSLQLRPVFGAINPSSRIIASTTFPSGSLGASLSTTTLEIYPPFVAMGSTTLAVVVQCIDAATTLVLGGSATDAYANGHNGIFDGSNWSYREDGFSFYVNNLGVTQDSVYPSQGLQAAVASSTLGVLSETIATGTTAFITNFGTSNAYGGLTPSNYLYLSYAAGISTTSAIEGGEKVGRAISSTTIQIYPYVTR